MGTLIKEWKNVKGYEKFYKVSNYGEIKSKRRVRYDIVDGEMQPVCVLKERLLNPFDNGHGYLTITLIDEIGNKKNFYMHRLVAEAFIPNPNNLPQVNHLDYDTKNNKVTNLEWCSAIDNTRYSLCHQPKTRKCFSSTGYKFICMKKEKYRVCFPIQTGKRIDKCFDTLEEAIEYRNLVAKETGIECKDNIN